MTSNVSEERVVLRAVLGQGTHMVIRVHRWVVWWFYLGVLGGVIALPNVFLESLTGFQIRVILLIGIVHWLFGGFVCWAWEGVKLDQSRGNLSASDKAIELHGAVVEEDQLTEFRSHHNRRTSPRHSVPRQETFTIYLSYHLPHH